MMAMTAIIGNRETLATLRGFLRANPEKGRTYTLLQLLQAHEGLKNNQHLQAVLAREGKQTTLLQAIALMSTKENG